MTTAVTVSAFLIFKLLTRTSQCRCTVASSPEGGERSPVLTSTNEHLAPEAVHSDALMEWQLLGQNQISAITRFAPQFCTRRARTIDCHRIRACLNGAILDYGLFAPDREAWSRSVITLVRNVS
ncbi:MAG: hypothetical protein E5V72_04395 [Mesorhizobium sp.]|nr:MAG: hypothetical protein E5V72_04395 [Mesorhizobium sp.]